MNKVFAFVISFLVIVPVMAQYKKGTFGHYTEIGALAATKNRPDNVTTAAFTFQTVNSYYRLQKGAIINSGVKEQYNNNRIALRAGFYL